MTAAQGDFLANGDKRLAVRDILVAIDMPRGQRNDRSAWTLLALGDLTPDRAWADVRTPIMGITPIIEWIAEHYGKRYAPNSRETIRRFSIHQFIEAGLVIYNSDEPGRPVNSPKAGYRLSPEAVSLLRSYGTPDWDEAVRRYLEEKPGLAARYAAERDLELVPVQIPGGGRIDLSPGAHSELIRDIVESFAPAHTPGARLIYVGDTGDKAGFFDKAALAEFGVIVDRHGKMPDVVLHDVRRDWMVLVESVTSHGPIDGKRHAELKRLFADCTVGLVFVTAFPDRAVMSRYLGELAWETEVWVATAPTHLIHFNGERFLGPY